MPCIKCNRFVHCRTISGKIIEEGSDKKALNFLCSICCQIALSKGETKIIWEVKK